jgi:hypothetical protein
MSKQFKCPKCGGSIKICTRLDDGTYLHDCACGFRWSESTAENTKYVVDVLAEPPRPTEDELMRVSPGLEVDRFDYLHVNCEYYDLDGIVRTWTHGDNRLVKQRWILRKRPDWANYQRENAEKWLEESCSKYKLIGLVKATDKDERLCILMAGELGAYNKLLGPINLNVASGNWRWVVEPKESVKEYALNWDSNYIQPMIIFHLRKICVSELSKEVFNGFKYADGSIEADFKRIRNGQVEWATKVLVKE